jgi:hypothetical protein
MGCEGGWGGGLHLFSALVCSAAVDSAWVGGWMDELWEEPLCLPSFFFTSLLFF